MNVYVFIGYLLLISIRFLMNPEATASDMNGPYTKQTAEQLNKQAEDTLSHDYHTSMKLAFKALGQAGDNRKQKARSCINIGEAYYKAEQYEKSTDYFLKANKIYQQLNHHEKKGYTSLSIGINHFYTGNYTESIRAYKNAELSFKKTGQKKKLALTYQNIGLVYNELDNGEKALEYLHQSQEIFTELDANLNMANNYHNIGSVYSKLNEYQKASTYYQKSYEIFLNLNNIHGLGSTLSNMGMVLEAEGKFQEAIEKYHEALVYFKQENNKFGELSVYHNMGCALTALNRFEDAHHYFKQSMSMSEKHGYVHNLMESHKELSDLFEKKKDYHNALKHYKSYINLKDSIDQNKTRTQIAEIESEYMHQLDKQELEKQQLKLQRSKIQNVGLLIFMLLFLTFSVVLYRTNIRRKKIQLQLNEHKHNLQRLLEEQSEKLNIEISERKLAEESDKLKSAFLANMSHELRTPMNAIIAFSSFLNNKDLSEEKRDEYIQHINSSGKSLLQIIDDIVDSAKIEAKQLKIHRKKTDITHLLKEVYELYIHSLKADNKEEIDLILDVPYKNPVIIKTDPVRLKQIISNLVENAKKYTQQGYIRFGYEIQSGHIEFFVEDTGIGIPEDKLKYIFERFSRIDYKDDVRLSGTGLGLAICKDLIELMEGSIKVRSEPGTGTVFTCSLPYNELEVQEDALPTRNDEQSTLDPADFNWQDKTVLIAEDEDLNFKVLQAALTRTGALIVRAMNGEEAIEICQQQKIDLILMDIQMPKIDGLEATRKIKSRLPALPIVAQTSFALNGERERCLKAGCDDYLSKPIDLQQLLYIAQHYLN